MIRRKLVDGDPTQLIWLRDLSSTLHQIGDVKQRTGDFTSAIAFYNAALDARRNLQRRQPDFQRIAGLIAESLNAAGAARLKLEARGPIDAERVWTEVVGEELEAMAARQAIAQRDPEACWNAIADELRAARP